MAGIGFKAGAATTGKGVGAGAAKGWAISSITKENCG
jgi:hypothetical protein